MNLKYDNILTKDFLIQEYIIKKKSSLVICKENNCSKFIVLKRLKFFNIPRRKIEDLNKERSLKGILHPNYKHGKVNKIKYCKDCNKKLSKLAYYNSYERCNSCNSKIRKGILSHNWQGGLSFEEYGVEFDDALKEKVRFRDGYKCQLCGCSQLENGKQLDVHHIDYDKKNNNIKNLIALCHICHMKTNSKNRSYWINLFKNVHGIFEVL